MIVPNLDEVEIGIMVNLGTFREVLKGLSTGGTKWWIASDPLDFAETGSITIGHGDPQYKDCLNYLLFRLPVLVDEMEISGTHNVMILFDATTLKPVQASYYMGGKRVMRDQVEDFRSVFYPLQQALFTRLSAE